MLINLGVFIIIGLGFSLVVSIYFFIKNPRLVQYIASLESPASSFEKIAPRLEDNTYAISFSKFKKEYRLFRATLICVIIFGFFFGAFLTSFLGKN